MNPRPVDEAARRRSIETLDRPLVVEAGAGTGKTTLLVERIVHALGCGAIRIPEVVALSFTEKAAAELGQRLRRALETAHCASEADPERQRLGAALADYDRATVGTIHAFAAGLLRAHPVAARLDPHFVMLDELESQHSMRRFWERWAGAQMELPEAAAHLRRALACGVRLEPELRDLAFEIYAQRDVEHLIARPALPVGLDAEVDALVAEIAACIAHAETHCRQASDAGLLKLRALGAQLELLADLEPENRVTFFMDEIGLGITAGRQDAWTPGEAAASKDMRRRIAARLETLRRGIAADGLHRVLPWLADFRRAYDVEKRRRAVLDFQDLLLAARDLVRDDLGVRRALGERIRMLCVDEFQDTDPLQAEIVFFLAERGTRPAVTWQAVDVGASLFLVGDPRQSIYRFRRADLDVYGRCVERILASGGARIDIEQSFRSRPAILAWVNATFAARFGGMPAMRHVPLVASAPAEGPAAVWILRGVAAENADAARSSEADGIVRWLHAAVAAGAPVRDEDGVLRPLRWGDIAVLFPRTSGIEAYEVALRAAGIPFQQEGGKLFFQRPEVRDVLAALAAVDDPRDELSLVAALRSPLGGVTDAELWEHQAVHGGFDYSRDVEGSPLAPALSTMRQLHAERHVRGLSGTIAALLAATGARAFHAAAANGGAALSNLDTLHRFATQFETGRPAGFREFVRVLRDFDEQAPRLAEWAPLEDAPDRVRLLTVHGAKGLEFPCVVLANLNARGNQRSGPVVVDRGADRTEVRLRCNEPHHFETAGYEAAAKRERVHAKEEEDRLLYVAATRARDYLVVPDVWAGKRDALLDMLASIPGALGTAAFGGLGAPGEGLDFAPGPGWRVVVVTALPPPPRPPAPPGGAGGAAAAAAELHARRAAWAAAHAARLARGRGAVAGPADP